MDNKTLGFCSIAAVLGIISAAIGFAAEATKVKASEVGIVNDDTCVYPSSPALALGIVSAVLTIITRIYISVSFGEGGCCLTGPNSTATSRHLFILSWVASVTAVLLLLTAAGLNNRQGGYHSLHGFECYAVKPGIFAAGALLALFSAVFGIAAYLTFTPQSRTNTYTRGALPMSAHVDLGKNPMPFHSQQYPPQ